MACATVFTSLTFLSPSFTVYDARTCLDWDGDTKVCLFKFANKDIIFGWLLSHIGISGNENADSAAKSALDLPHVKVGVSYTYFKQHINQNILSTWQSDWNGAVANKLHSVKPVLEIGSPVVGSPGRMKLFCVMSTLVIHI